MEVFHCARGLLCAVPVFLLSAQVSAATKDDEIAKLKAELEATKQQLSTTQSTLEKVEQRLDQLEENASAATPAAAPSGPRLAPVNADNPAISFVVDTTAKTDTEGTGFDFALQSGELFISAPIDPFLRGYAALNGSSEEHFDIEEAAVITTALPWNLTVKGGRFHADAGRMPHWHDEQLPFVDRPPSIDRMFGGESNAEGVEVSWLAPTEQYFHLTTGVYNTLGAERREDLSDNGFSGRRAFDELTFLAHPSTYVDLTDTLNLELGGTFASVPEHNRRYLYGVDATLRHQPGTSGFYQGFVLGSEWYWNDEDVQAVQFGVDPGTGEPILGDRQFDRNGGYAYLETFLGRRYSVGGRFDYAEAISDARDLQRTYSAFATWMPSEFHRLRFQVDQIDLQSAQNDQRFTLQWTAFLGSHSHGFTAR